jgi:hypothetical protein
MKSLIYPPFFPPPKKGHSRQEHEDADHSNTLLHLCQY